jgi:hypothetical protein
VSLHINAGGPREHAVKKSSSGAAEAPNENRGAQRTEAAETKTRQSNYEITMSDIEAKYGCPAYPGFRFNRESESVQVGQLNKSGLKMRMRVTDYLANAWSSRQWEQLTTWAESLGFTVVRDHGAVQIGVSCGIVAARVATWLHNGFGDEPVGDFMSVVTTGAVAPEILKEANRCLAHMDKTTRDDNIPMAWGSPNARGDATETKFLWAESCEYIAQNYNRGRPVMIYGDQHADANKFLRFFSFDQFLHMVAQNVHKACTEAVFGRHGLIVNIAVSRTSGSHWVSVVNEITQLNAL